MSRSGECYKRLKSLKHPKKPFQVIFSSDMLTHKKAIRGRLTVLCLQIVLATENKHLPNSNTTNWNSQKSTACALQRGRSLWHITPNQGLIKPTTLGYL